MNALGRIKRILRAAVQDVIRKATDPEFELAKFVEKAELSLGEVRAELEEAELRRDALQRGVAEERTSAQGWMEKAERAAADDQDEAAKEALRRHRKARDEAESCEERLAEAELSVATLRKDEAELEQKLREAQLEQKRLSTKLRRAEAEGRAGAVLFEAEDDADAPRRTEEKIMDTGAAGEARREVHEGSVEARFRELSAPPSLDEELAELKRRVKQKKGKEA